MATYAKILKNIDGDQILPYTRSKLVYMDDGSTVEEAVLRPAINTQLGRVIIGNGLGYDSKGTISLGKIGITSTLGYVPVSPDDYGSKNAHGVVQVGSNINVDNGVISINSANIISALGYTLSSGSSTITSNDVTNALGYTPANDGSLKYYNTPLITGIISGTAISLSNSNLGGGFRIFQQGAICYFFFYCTTTKDYVANTTTFMFDLQRNCMPCPIEANSSYNQSNYLKKTGILRFPAHWSNSSNTKYGEFYIETQNYASNNVPYMQFITNPSVTIPSGSRIVASCTYMTQYYSGQMANTTEVNSFNYSDYVNF